MLFNSFQFLIFFPIVTAIYFLLPHKLRWFFLLVASCYFYMSFIPYYIFILAFTVTVDYFSGIRIEKSEGSRKKIWLVASIVANVGVLFVFKYFNFFNQNLTELANFLHWNYSLQSLALILPIGLSFHTFQSLAYTIEVYRGKFTAETNPGILALYVMFYPQLVAGPIERPQNLIHQFREKHDWDRERILAGLKLMLWGLFKKIVIADSLAGYVNLVYNHVSAYHAPTLLIATVFFAFQIYCDFSGYSDIARGAAKVMGFRLMDNFRQPYFSRSISEFWRRWHISLSSWFRDYVYIPLGGNRVSKNKYFINIIITFLLSGIWHGANWTFAIWGLLNGFYLIAATIKNNFIKKYFAFTENSAGSWARSLWQTFSTFILICFAWIFFRANNFHDASTIILKIFTDWHISTANFLNNYIYLNANGREFFWMLIGIIILIIAEISQVNNWDKKYLDLTNKDFQSTILKYALNWLAISTAVLLILLSNNSSQPFIYFQF
jgi:alginate O-acetyltransferase complex protein AlgI